VHGVRLAPRLLLCGLLAGPRCRDARRYSTPGTNLVDTWFVRLVPGARPLRQPASQRWPRFCDKPAVFTAAGVTFHPAHQQELASPRRARNLMFGGTSDYACEVATTAW